METVEVPNVEESAHRVLHAVEGTRWTPVTSTPSLRAAIEKAFRRIEELDKEISERRKDIKEVKSGLTGMGLKKNGVDIALARRKLAATGDLESTDETLMVICGVGPLMIQGSLFADRQSGEGGNGAA